MKHTAKPQNQILYANTEYANFTLIDSIKLFGVNIKLYNWLVTMDFFLDSNTLNFRNKL